MEPQRQEELNQESKKSYFLSQKIDIDSNLDDIIFLNRFKIAKEKELLNDYNEAIKYDNVTENIIYEYLSLNKNNLNFSDLETKTMALALSEEHFNTLGLNFDYVDFKQKFFEFMDLLKADIFEAYKSPIKQSLVSLYVNEELSLNQPLSFQNSPNLMFYSLLNFLLPSSKDPIKNFDNIQTRHNNVCILEEYLRKIETLTDVQIWNIIFYTLSITEEKYVLDLKEKLIEKKIEDIFPSNNNVEEIKWEVKDETLYGFKNNEEIIKIPNIKIFDVQLLKNLITKIPIKINDTNEIYDNIDLLKCIKIEYLNNHNYFSPHLINLKKIVKDILTSKAIDEYINKFTDHKSSLNPFKNEIYYNSLWDKYVHFVIFQKEEFQAETFRVYHKIFLNALPIIFFPLDKRLLRLFNYALFIVISIHEFLGHLEKMVLYYVYKKIKVKTEEFETTEFNEYFADDLDEEMEFLKSEFKMENSSSIKNEDANKIENGNNKKDSLILQFLHFAENTLNNDNAFKIMFDYSKDNKKEYLLELEKIIKSYKNINSEELTKGMKILSKLSSQGKSSDNDFEEGGFIVENILFGSEVFADRKHLSINKALFLLNSNNYNSIDNMRKISTMFMSYRFAKKNDKDYLNVTKFNGELLIILNNLNITNEFLLEQDKILFSTMYSDLLENAVKGKKYKIKRYNKRISCIPSHA